MHRILRCRVCRGFKLSDVPPHHFLSGPQQVVRGGPPTEGSGHPGLQPQLPRTSPRMGYLNTSLLDSTSERNISSATRQCPTSRTVRKNGLIDCLGAWQEDGGPRVRCAASADEGRQQHAGSAGISPQGPAADWRVTGKRQGVREGPARCAISNRHCELLTCAVFSIHAYVTPGAV